MIRKGVIWEGRPEHRNSPGVQMDYQSSAYLSQQGLNIKLLLANIEHAQFVLFNIRFTNKKII